MPDLDLSALDTRLPAPRRPAGYRASAALVAVGMVALPLLYVALLAAVGAAVAWWAVAGLGLAAALPGGWLTLFGYLAPLFVGAVALVFLVKPLFARPARRGEPVSLRRADEPALFAFAEGLAAAVGAPAPSRIDVDAQANASASFRRGVLSMASQDLVLTIGLPLAGALSVRQLAGVLAHEYGHFTQGAGMRLTYLVEAVSRWFERVVYERDRLDVWLDEALADARNLWWGIALRVAAAAVTAGRGVLKGLMLVGRRLSRSLLRQMEFDADGFEVRVAGPAAFRETTEALALLHVAAEGTFDDVERLRREGRLPDDLPALMLAADLGPELRAAVVDGLHAQRTGPLDTHPAPAERVAAAERVGGTGLALPDAPARALFADFDALCRRATDALYRASVPDQVDRLAVVPTAAVLAERTATADAFDALGRLLLGVRTVPGPPPDVPDGPPEPGALDRARERCRDLAEGAAEAVDAWGAAHGRLRALAVADELVRAKAGFDPAAFEIGEASHAAVARAREAAQATIDAATPAVDAFDAAVRERIGLALAALPEADRGVLAWADVLVAVRAVRDDANALSDDLAAAEALLDAYRAAPRAEHLAHRAGARAEALHGLLRRIRQALHAAPHPDAGDGVSLAAVVVPEVPPMAEGLATLQVAADVARRLHDVRLRAWAALAAAAERAEARAEAATA